ncbi:MAG: GNAT family N-acetyltransferase [Lachnospiraceae bacterium]|nr:GNAT family N-acetyltransferase [Lachnospiraceae bacterium]
MAELEFIKNIHYRELCLEEIDRKLFENFIRHQKVTRCWRKENNIWIIKNAPFIDDWTEKDYQTLIDCLKHTITSGGFVYAAFYDGSLKGFVSVEPVLFGGEQKYLDLSSIHVSEDMRGQGIGKSLFLAAKDWAKKKGAKKLYISSHSAVESQAFYKAMGCVEAQEYDQKHVEQEPYDCQLECELLKGITYKTEKKFKEQQLKELFESVHWLSANYSVRLVNALVQSDTVISAWDGDKLIGLINAIDDGELTAYAHYLLINPEYQKMGIGTELIVRLKRRYEGYLNLILMAENKELVYFYEKLGFKVLEGAIPMVLQTL